MTLLLTAESLTKSYGSQNLFTDISFSLRQGDRTGLVGPNGSGKSSLLKILSGIEPQDSGRIAKKQGVRIAYVPQFSEFTGGTVEEIALSRSGYPSEEEGRVAAVSLLHRAGFSDLNQSALNLSGGRKKRLDIVRALMEDPDLVLLDEPTNHLDLEGILWLEGFLRRDKRSYLIVSHDRRFLDGVCTKMIEINRCFPKGSFTCEGNWSEFREKKQAFLEARLEEERSLASTAREEVDWMRRAPKARTCKSKSRMERGEELLEELREIRKNNTVSQAEIRFAASERETRNLLVCKNLTKSLGNGTLFSGLDLKLSPGTRLGVLGENGTGKTTLLRVLAGELQPDAGTVKYAADLKLVYFDQHRETIEPDVTVREALCPYGEYVTFQGRDIHVNGWAKRFLFPPEKLVLPVRALSGGEKARILLARLMLKPADLLFLDEPTNDLDIPTLEVMEKSLSEFPGAVVLISHDRFLIDRVCNVVLGLGSRPGLFADYEQWKASEPLTGNRDKKSGKEKQSPASGQVQKKSYKQKKEAEEIEPSIAEVEGQLRSLEAKLPSAAAPSDSSALYREMADLQTVLDGLYEKWYEKEG